MAWACFFDLTSGRYVVWSTFVSLLANRGTVLVYIVLVPVFICLNDLRWDEWINENYLAIEYSNSSAIPSPPLQSAGGPSQFLP